jgi:hypothetical protein
MRTRLIAVVPALALCGLLAGTLCQAETWRWVDKDGVVHLSDRPVPGATQVQLPKAPAPVAAPPPVVAATSGANTGTAPPPFAYASCAITTPLNDQVLANTNSASASVDLQPALRSGDRLEVRLDGGTVAGWPATSTSYFLNNLFRGTHSLVVVVRDPAGVALCSGREVKFHVTQPSVLAPARR